MLLGLLNSLELNVCEIVELVETLASGLNVGRPFTLCAPSYRVHNKCKIYYLGRNAPVSHRQPLEAYLWSKVLCGEDSANTLERHTGSYM